LSLIGSFSKQTAVLERATGGYDVEAQPAYDAPETIRVRKEPASGVRRSATGQDVDVETVYMTETVIALQDRVDGSEVRRVEDIVDKGGKRLGCEFYV
jgi:hypothetical protein